MKTAINWLLDELKNLSESQLQHKDFQLYMQKQYIIINNAKEKEKEQIIEANRQGRCNDCPIMYTTLEAQEYYNQTYKP